jgi:hypothetical protein
MSDDQIEWLELTLEESRLRGEKVIVAGHCPLFLGAATSHSVLMWSY